MTRSRSIFLSFKQRLSSDGLSMSLKYCIPDRSIVRILERLNGIKVVAVRMLDACVLYWDGGDTVAKMEQRRQRFAVRIMLLHE